ncbi:APC family permease [Francisella marina]|uniref:APC family permease n=1 Tax=Francisella marina TaxID=2249302 RepID=A0ABX5ZEE3_9GAMM|nr:APC family permease [Francisella marina]QEO56623.1 APC family permease [Francisella marina]QEO59257.1 APC family permease [Francisella marina]
MQKSISLTSLIGIGITSLIGSSWLFTAEYSTKIAGYASIVSWIVAAIITFVIALSFMEFSTLFSTNGASSKVPTIIYGPMTGFIFAVFTWLSYMMFVPIESHAIIQYLAVYFPTLLKNQTHHMIAGIIIVALSCLLNFLSISLISRINSYFTILKIIIPIFVALFIVIFCLSTPEQATHYVGDSSPHILTWKWSEIFTAITMGGIAFSFIGFKTIIEIAGEAHNPKSTIPLSIILVILISLIIFLLVQIAYFYSAKNFDNVYVGTNELGAFGVVASNIGSRLLSTILYFSALTFPFICGVMYLRVSVESLNVLITENILLQDATKNRKGMKTYMLISFIISLFIFFIFDNWAEVSTFIAALMAITYLIGPLATMNFRKSIPDVNRAYKLKAADVTCFLSFYFSSIIIFFSGWNTIVNIVIFAIICSTIFIIIEKTRVKSHKLHFLKSLWFFLHIICITIISFCYNTYPEYFSLILTLLLIFIFSLVTYIYALSSNLSIEEIKRSYTNLITKNHLNSKNNL